MLKHNEQSITGKTMHVGYIQFFEWISCQYMMPRKSGTYYTSDNLGNVKTMMLANMEDPINRRIFEDGYELDTVCWSDSGIPLTDSELVEVCNRVPHRVWYYMGNNDEDPNLYIVPKYCEPLYWAFEDSLRGPNSKDEARSPIHETNTNDYIFKFTSILNGAKYTPHYIPGEDL